MSPSLFGSVLLVLSELYPLKLAVLRMSNWSRIIVSYLLAERERMMRTSIFLSSGNEKKSLDDARVLFITSSGMPWLATVLVDEISFVARTLIVAQNERTIEKPDIDACISDCITELLSESRISSIYVFEISK